MKRSLFTFLAAASALITFAQQPVSLRPDVQVQFVMNVPDHCARIAYDPATGKMHFITSDGDVYAINNLTTNSTRHCFTLRQHTVSLTCRGLPSKAIPCC